MAIGRSIHIGLNHVDPAAYGGWDGALAGCINDARDMQAIAMGLGYQSPLLLTDSMATSSRVVSEIGQAAQALGPGDILFLSYSGHGGQVDDVNGDESEGLDETWVLWDRQLIDDELFSLWSQFAAGVRIIVLSDSCHSGTVLRMVQTVRDLGRDLRGKKDMPTPGELAVVESLSRAIGLDQGSGNGVSAAPVYAEAGAKRGTKSRATPAVATAPAPDALVRAADLAIARTKTIPPDVRDLVNATRRDTDAAIQWVAGPSERAVIGASVLLISGCQDHQLSSDGAANGLFTEKLKAAWNNGAFSGGYRAFWQDILARMPASQQPNFDTAGVADPAFEAQKPFTIGGGGGVVPVPTGRPVLRRGSQGPDVIDLQSLLVGAGYPVGVDGQFGPMTEAAVVAFQVAHGLAPDGVVGPQTWAALGSSGGSTPPQPSDGGSSGTTGSARPTLRQGASGPDVSYLQQRLVANGHNVAVDGSFGPMTASAVRAFQQAHGLAADGVVGPQTWAALG